MKNIILWAAALLLIVPALAQAAANPYQAGTREHRWYQQQQLKRQQKNQNRDATGVYKRYQPAAKKTPVPKYKRPQGTVVKYHKPSIALAIKGGIGLPLADAADVADSGFATNLDFYYRATSSLTLDIFGAYFSAPYKDSQAPDPMTLTGGGFRALFHPFKTPKMVPHIGAGLGYMGAKRATWMPTLGPTGFPIKDPTDPSKVIGTTVYESSGGIAFTGVVGATYEIVDRIGLQIELSVYSVSLSGGTTDSITAAQMGVGIQYSF